MPNIFISLFAGLVPQVSPRLLGDNNAQVASNIKLNSGEMHPLKNPLIVAQPNKTYPLLSMYLASSGDNSAWFSWDTDVDVVRAPLSTDSESRFYWTGDGAPKFSKFSVAIASGLNKYPDAGFSLGIPTPIDKPSVSVTGGSGAIIDRFYTYTFFSRDGEESAPSPVSTDVSGNVDGTWSISGMDTFPSNSGGGTASFSSGTGLTTFTNTGNHWLRVDDQVVIGSTTLSVVSTPSNTSFTVAGNYATATSWSRKDAWNTTGIKRRLYRTTGTTGTFQLVSDDVGTSYSDTLTDANILGDELISKGWIPPATNLQGLIVHASGALVGFYKNQLYFSEPYQPHAWPSAYKLSTDYDIVGIATYGSEIVVTTKGNPYIASGVDPVSMTMQKVDGMYPCLSKRSVVSIGYGVVYASTHGLIYLGGNGVSVYTKDLFTKDEWAVHNPSNMACEFAYGRVYVTTTGTNGRRYMLIFNDGILTTADVTAYELYTDAATGTLYLSNDSGIAQWDAGSTPMTGSWKSKVFLFPNPVNLGAAKIELDTAIDTDVRDAILQLITSSKSANVTMIATGKIKSSINDYGYNEQTFNGSALQEIPDIPANNNVMFILYSNGVPVFSKTVKNNLAFRLPAGFKTDQVELMVISQSNVNQIRVAETMSGLKEI